MIIDQSAASWFKSSKSANASECVEIAFLGDSANNVGIRDSKNPGGPALMFSGDQWDCFLSSGIWQR
ncbi:DUF397 domain-containing protein [Nocardia sp. NPDC051030]|uniref:DUF397 domain-containing protein n=1 Tax=Nocardia sp. NPDC051030 TaxID=3155162 RepID=UPI00341986DF